MVGVIPASAFLGYDPSPITLERGGKWWRVLHGALRRLHDKPGRPVHWLFRAVWRPADLETMSNESWRGGEVAAMEGIQQAFRQWAECLYEAWRDEAQEDKPR
jgi:truncated hemoglobin YjbI